MYNIHFPLCQGYLNLLSQVKEMSKLLASHLTPPQEIQYLGFVVDSRLMELFLPQQHFLACTTLLQVLYNTQIAIVWEGSKEWFLQGYPLMFVGGFLCFFFGQCSQAKQDPTVPFPIYAPSCFFIFFLLFTTLWNCYNSQVLLWTAWKFGALLEHIRAHLQFNFCSNRIEKGWVI